MTPQTPKAAAFELGMHSAFKRAGVKTQKQAAVLFKYAKALSDSQRALQTRFAAYELGLRKTAADHGLLSTDEQDAFVEVARKLAAEKLAALGMTGAPPAPPAPIGGQMSTGTPALQGIQKPKMPAAPKPAPAPGQAKAQKIAAIKTALLGLGGSSAGQDIGSIGAGVKGLAQKATQKVKAHPTTSAALLALLAGAAGGAHLQKRRDQSKLGAEKTAKLQVLEKLIKGDKESPGRKALNTAGTLAATGAGTATGAVLGQGAGEALGLSRASALNKVTPRLPGAEKILPAEVMELVKKIPSVGRKGMVAGGVAGGTAAALLAKKLLAKKETPGLVDRAKGGAKDLRAFVMAKLGRK